MLFRCNAPKDNAEEPSRSTLGAFSTLDGTLGTRDRFLEDLKIRFDRRFCFMVAIFLRWVGRLWGFLSSVSLLVCCCVSRVQFQKRLIGLGFELLWASGDVWRLSFIPDINRLVKHILLHLKKIYQRSKGVYALSIHRGRRFKNSQFLSLLAWKFCTVRFKFLLGYSFRTLMKNCTSVCIARIMVLNWLATRRSKQLCEPQNT